MVPVVMNHVPDILDVLRTPNRALIYVLPARCLGEHQKAEPVALIKEILGLRIMGRADGIEPEMIFQNSSVIALYRFRHGIADIGIALMSIQTADL